MSDNVLPPQWARYAKALAVERVHGAAAPAFIATRIADLVRLGDEAGVNRWREIADRYDRLQRQDLIS